MPGQPKTRAKHAAEIAPKLPRGAAGLILSMERACGATGPLSLERYVKQLQDDMQAMRTVFDKAGNPHEVPDDRAREGAKNRWERLIAQCLAYGIGLPVQRQLTIQVNEEVDRARAVEMLEHPRMQELLADLAAKRRAGGGENGGALDVPAAPTLVDAGPGWQQTDDSRHLPAGENSADRESEVAGT